MALSGLRKACAVSSKRAGAMRSERMPSTFSRSCGIGCRSDEEFFAGALVEGGGVHFVLAGFPTSGAGPSRRGSLGTISFQIKAWTFAGAMKSCSTLARA